MRTLLLLPFCLPACTLSPEGRAYVLASLRDQQQRAYEQGMANQSYMQNALHQPFQRRSAEYPTYYARPDPLCPGGSIITPNRFGY